MNNPRLSSLASKALMTFLTIFLLTGCISRQETAVIQTAPAAPMAGQPARPAGPLVINKTAPVGQMIDIITLNNVNPDCTPGTLGTLRVTQQPMHGTASIVQGESYPSFAANNPRSVCNKTKSPSVSIKYTPAQGFSGSDLMAVEAFTSSGGDSSEIKVLLTVK